MGLCLGHIRKNSETQAPFSDLKPLTCICIYVYRYICVCVYDYIDVYMMHAHASMFIQVVCGLQPRHGGGICRTHDESCHLGHCAHRCLLPVTAVFEALVYGACQESRQSESNNVVSSKLSAERFQC